MFSGVLVSYNLYIEFVLVSGIVNKISRGCSSDLNCDVIIKYIMNIVSVRVNCSEWKLFCMFLFCLVIVVFKDRGSWVLLMILLVMVIVLLSLFLVKFVDISVICCCLMWVILLGFIFM